MSAMSVQPTPQASPVTANGQPTSQPDAPSSPPLVQEDSVPRSEEAAEVKQGPKQDPLLNGVCSFSFDLMQLPSSSSFCQTGESPCVSLVPKMYGWLESRATCQQSPG